MTGHSFDVTLRRVSLEDQARSASRRRLPRSIDTVRGRGLRVRPPPRRARSLEVQGDAVVRARTRVEPAPWRSRGTRAVGRAHRRSAGRTARKQSETVRQGPARVRNESVTPASNQHRAPAEIPQSTTPRPRTAAGRLSTPCNRQTPSMFAVLPPPRTQRRGRRRRRDRRVGRRWNSEVRRRSSIDARERRVEALHVPEAASPLAVGHEAHARPLLAGQPRMKSSSGGSSSTVGEPPPPNAMM